MLQSLKKKKQTKKTQVNVFFKIPRSMVGQPCTSNLISTLTMGSCALSTAHIDTETWPSRVDYNQARARQQRCLDRGRGTLHHLAGVSDCRGQSRLVALIRTCGGWTSLLLPTHIWFDLTPYHAIWCGDQLGHVRDTRQGNFSTVFRDRGCMSFSIVITTESGYGIQFSVHSFADGFWSIQRK